MNTELLDVFERMELENGRTINLNVRDHRVVIQILPQHAEPSKPDPLSISSPVEIEDFEELDVPSPDWPPMGSGIPCEVTMGEPSLPDPPIIACDDE